MNEIILRLNNTESDKFLLVQWSVTVIGEKIIPAEFYHIRVWKMGIWNKLSTKKIIEIIAFIMVPTKILIWT